MTKKGIMSMSQHLALMTTQNAAELLLKMGGFCGNYKFCRQMMAQLNIANMRSARIIIEWLVSYGIAQTDGKSVWITTEKPDVFAVFAARHKDELVWSDQMCNVNENEMAS